MSTKILLIQDKLPDTATIRDALGGPSGAFFELECLCSCAEGVERLARELKHDKRRPGDIQAVLLDLFLPDSQGIETFKQLFRVAPQIPILVVTELQHEPVAKLAVTLGAQDYVLKSRIDSYLLPKALHNMLERTAIAEALFEQQERAQITLNSIGDAVLSTDVQGRVTYLNSVAEKLTGWTLGEAAGRPLEDVFRIVDSVTREAARNPMSRSIDENQAVALTPNCTLIRRNGSEAAIEDSAAPIHDRHGQVTGAVMVFRDVSASRELSQRMSYLAQHDSLTDLPNRVLLNDRLGQAITAAFRQGQKLAVLFMDIDRFKHVNDSLGHAIGDRLLQSVAQRLLGCVRGSDTVSRQGGDEFVILLSQVTQAQDAAVTADKMLLSLSAPYHIEQHDLHLTVSIGIATYPDDGVDAASLIGNADIAMYHAKDGGRNNFQFFKPDMNLRAVERQSIENGLRRALDQQDFELHYQPTMNLETGTIVGAEALLRWHHPNHGLVLPALIIPIAEESGMIVPIGRWVLREACRQAQAWQDEGMPPMQLSVNISAVELRAPDFVDSVRAILRDTGLDPRHLELELTETFLMQDSISTIDVLLSIKALGVQLALDDFGTGYSSLSHLRRFPITTLKIDQSFVRNLTSDADDASIVRAVIAMGKSLNLRVVAEGVETTGQLTLLQQQQCLEGQGYLFSRPLGAEKFAELLEHPI